TAPFQCGVPSCASAYEHLLAAAAGWGAGREAGGRPRGQEFVLRPAAQEGGEVARDDRRHHEAVAAEAAHDVEAGHVGQLADDGIAVGADVVGPGPLAHDLDVT